eukprot:1155174-Pelagomonas_calceolata.AAC.1
MRRNRAPRGRANLLPDPDVQHYLASPMLPLTSSGLENLQHELQNLIGPVQQLSSTMLYCTATAAHSARCCEQMLIAEQSLTRFRFTRGDLQPDCSADQPVTGPRQPT